MSHQSRFLQWPQYPNISGAREPVPMAPEIIMSTGHTFRPMTTVAQSPHFSSTTNATKTSPEKPNGGASRRDLQLQSRRPRLRYFLRQQARLNRFSERQNARTFDTSSNTSSDTLSERKASNGLGLMVPASPCSLERNTSNDFTQRLENRILDYNSSENHAKRWLLEIISLFFSAMCMAAIIGVLLFLKDERLPKWPLGLTLNAYVSIFSKAAGAALLLPTTEALGQLKWDWFQQGSKNIVDFEIFDDASRGPWGSFMLLFRIKGRSLAALGAIITIFALALDPFFQQVIDFPDRWISSGQESSVPIVRVYDSADVVMFQNGKRSAVQEAPIKIVADKFVTGNGSQPIQFGGVTKPEIPVFCPTSNCTWPAYESLGVCSSCTDVSDMLTFGCLYTRVDWVRNLTGGSESVPKYPNGTQCGYFLNITSARPILMSGYLVDSVQSEAGGGDAGEALLMRALPLISNPSRFPLYGDGSINFKNIQNKLQNGIIASIPDGLIENVYQNKSPVAQECVLAWCVKKIESSWYSGSYEEKVIDTYFNETKSGYPWLLDSDGRATAYPGNSTILAPAGNGSAIYGLSNNTSVGTVNVFDDLFPSFYTTKNASDKPTLRLSTNALIPRWRTLEFNPWVSPNNVTRHLERLCAAITDALRNSNSKEMFLGQAWVVEPYVAVRWQFLSLPILLLVFCTIFLATTIYSNSSPQDVWKNSAVAILIHGLPDNIQKKIRSSTTHMGITQTKTKDLKVELQSKGWRASGFFPMTPRQDWNRPPPGWI